MSLFPDDGAFGLEIRWLDVGDQAPDKTGTKAFLEPLNGRRRGVGGENDLVPSLVEGVERVEELLLRSLLTRQDVDVIEEEDVDRAVGIAELCHPLEPDGVDKLVDEVLSGNVADMGARIAG